MYYFEGNYKSSPEQNFSGSSRPRGKAELLDTAARERQNRERARLEEKRIVFVQSRFRGFSTRKRLRRYLKNEFDSHIENAVSSSNLVFLSRILYFIHDESSVLKLSEMIRQNLNLLGPDWLWRIKNLVVLNLFPEGYHNVDFFTDDTNLKSIRPKISHEIITYAISKNYFETFFSTLPSDFSLKMIMKAFPTNSDIIYAKFYENLHLSDRKTVKQILKNIKDFNADKFIQNINKKNSSILFFVLNLDIEDKINFFKKVAFMSENVIDEETVEFFNRKKYAAKWSGYGVDDVTDYLMCLYNFKRRIPYMNALYGLARNPVFLFKIWDFLLKQKREDVPILNLVINSIPLENEELKILPCLSIFGILLQILYSLDGKFDFINEKVLLDVTLGMLSLAYDGPKVKNEELWSDALCELVAALSLMEPSSNLRLSSVKIYDTNAVINEPFKKKKNEEGYVLSAQENRTFFILNKIPFAVSFRQRFSCLQNFFGSLMKERDFSNRFVRIRRDFIYEDAFKGFENEDLRSNIKIQMVNSHGLDEAGVDGGGIFREFIHQLLKTAFHPQRNFFRYNDDNELYPNSSEKNPRHFKFIGKMLAKAIFEGILVEIRLAECLLCRITDKKNNLICLKSMDRQIYKNVVDLLHVDLSNLELDFTFYKDGVSHELKPGGRQIAVDEDNVAEYVNLVADFMTDFDLEPFLDGISEVFPSSCLHMFTPNELQMIISGQEGFDVDDMKLFTVYSGGFHAEDQTIILFWEVISDFTDDEKSQLLRFITSYSRPPLMGFSEIRPPLCIQKAEDGRFPTSSTCMHLLKLPTFHDRQTLRSKLLYAIQSGTGFELS